RRVGDAAPFGRYVASDDLRTAREGNAFSNAEHNTQDEERGEPAGKAHQESAPGPQKDASRHQFVDRETVAQPTGKELHRRIDPEEGREGDSVRLRGQPESVLHLRSCPS